MSQVKWYWAVSCDNTVANPFAANQGDLGAYKESELDSCKRIIDWPVTAWVRASGIEHDGVPDDVLQTLLGLPIYSSRMGSALDLAGIHGIQYLPLRVLRPTDARVEGFWIANILNCAKALHWERSKYELFPDDYFLPQRRGQIQALYEVVLLRRALEGYDIVRLQEYQPFICVSERFVRVFEAGGFTGYSFHERAVVDG